MRIVSSLIGLALVAQPLCAQMQAPVARGAASITAEDVSRRVHIIAHDSMMGRDTPSRGLDMTAQYIADEFQRLGLKPGGEDGTFFQRYPLVRTGIDVAKSHVGIMRGGQHQHVEFASDAVLRAGGAAGEVGGPVVVMAGTPDSAAVAAAAAGNVVLYVGDFTKPATMRSLNGVLISANAAGAKAMVAVSNRPTPVFDRLVASQGGTRLQLPGATRRELIPVVEMRESAAAAALTAAGLDVAALRGATAPVIRPVNGLRMMVHATMVSDTVRAPNTIGILEGSDPELRDEYIVFSAHMDHDGVGTPRPGTTDSIWNGADDDASGTIGVVELAEAFAQPGARPKRSLVFLTVSGEEKGLLGSRWYSDHPTVPLAQTVANINMDMIGRNWTDTIVVIGKEHSDLGATLNRVNAAHPELGMTAIDDIWPDERFYFRSDHFNFARKGVPILFFFNGTHEDYHQPTDSPDKIDAEKEARVLKLVYYLGQEVGNAAERPKWRQESYDEIVGSER